MGDSGTVDQQARRRERRMFAVGIAVLVVALVGGGIGGGILVGSAEDGPDRSGLDSTGWQILLASLVGLAVLVVALTSVFVWWRRRRGTTLFARSPLWELPDRRSRTALVKALRRGDPIAPEQRELARRVARDWIGRRGLVWLYLVLAVIQGANAVLQPDFGRWVSATGALLFLAGAGYFWWLIHRMRRALARLDGEAATPA